MSDEITTNKWKLATIGLLAVGVTALITSLVIGRDTKVVAPEEIVQNQETETKVAEKEPVSEQKPAEKVAAVTSAPKPAPKAATAPPPVPAPKIATAPPPAPAPVYNPPQPAYPPESVIQACNKYATEQVDSKTGEVVKGAGIGALLGAATGAAVGAIAGGGKGAAKGAGIGAIGGGVGGTLYGLNENQSNDARYQEAYASCMRMRGY